MFEVEGEEGGFSGQLRAHVASPIRHHVLIRTVEVNGQNWKDFDNEQEVIRLTGKSGTIAVRANY